MQWTQAARLTSALPCGRQSRVVLTPRRRRQVSGGDVGPNGPDTPLSAGDGDKKARSPGSAKETVKTIAQETPGVSGEPVVTMLVCFFNSHARLRVQRAPGFPCALCFETACFFVQLGRAAPRERGRMSLAKAFSSLVASSFETHRGACHRARIRATRWRCSSG
jgi:hypothetical protein